MATRNGVLFLNMGGPENRAEVRPFLERLFSDKDIVPLPLPPRAMRLFGRTFAAFRAPTTRGFYAEMGGGSPQIKMSTRQAVEVTRRLATDAPDRGTWTSYLAFRYSSPDTQSALEAIRRDGIERLFVVPLYPQYSSVTTGSSLAELDRALAAWAPREVVRVLSYHDDPGYVDALAGVVNRALSGLSQAQRGEGILIFSAHSLPMKVVEKGDPYPREIEATVNAVASRLAYPIEWRLAWQSQARPFVRWLEPRTDEVVRELGLAGRKTLVMAPVAFVQEHVETLYEMDRLYAALAKRVGIETFVRVPALNDDPAFLDALAKLVRKAAERS